MWLPAGLPVMELAISLPGLVALCLNKAVRLPIGASSSRNDTAPMACVEELSSSPPKEPERRRRIRMPPAFASIVTRSLRLSVLGASRRCRTWQL